MESLEDELVRVDRLSRDLSAEIIVQEEEGHCQTVDNTQISLDGRPYYPDGQITREEWVVDNPRIAESDIERSEPARQKLQQIYESSEWYSTRYQAGRALGQSIEKLGSFCISELKQQLKSEIIVRDKCKRKKAEKDLARLKAELKKTYNTRTYYDSDRKQAGKALSYSSLRIWLHEPSTIDNLVAIAVTGTIMGLAIGLAYYISSVVQYLSKKS